jgi:hypothetical protein
MKATLLAVCAAMVFAIVVQAGAPATVTIYNPLAGVTYPVTSVTSNGNITNWSITADQVGSITILPLKNGNPLPGPNVLNPWKKMVLTNSTSATGTFTNVSALTTDTLQMQVQSVTGVQRVQITLTTSP